MSVVICRGLIAAGGPDGTLTQATLYLGVFAALGCVFGQIAEATIEESVRAGLEQRLNAAQPANKEATA
jgi:hypothetical protein